MTGTGSPLIVVLCHAGDRSALWVAERLRARGAGRVETVLVEGLAAASTGWHQEIRDSGSQVTITLGDGRVLRSGAIDAVLNRMTYPPAYLTRAAVEPDEDYARSELTSFAASWLRALAPRVINPATPQGLCGRWRPPASWRYLAQQAGLPAVDLVIDSAAPPEPGADDGPGVTVLTVGGRPLVPDVPDGVQQAVARLTELAATPVLGLRFAGTDPRSGGWRLLDATPYPDLATAGDTGVAALAEELAA